jgi:hypothetical protein
VDWSWRAYACVCGEGERGGHGWRAQVDEYSDAGKEERGGLTKGVPTSYLQINTKHYVHTNAHGYVYGYVNTFVYMYMYKYACIRINVHIIYVYICICTML